MSFFSKESVSELKKVFFAGILVSLPLAFTLFLLKFLFVYIDNLLSPLFTEILIGMGYTIDSSFRIPGLGIVGIIVVIFLIGLFTRNIIGKTFIRFYEAVLVRIPILKNIYVGAKQVIETFGNSMGGSFNKVVMIEYPRKNVYALAFITSQAKGEVVRHAGQEMVNVFLPTTPNPTSGFFLLVPKEEIIELEMSVEDGVKMIISGGLVTPPDSAEKKTGKDEA
jgi:uncharacterized membrane protein